MLLVDILMQGVGVRLESGVVKVVNYAPGCGYSM